METRIGVVTHYFTRLSVAAIQLTGDIKIGDLVCIRGHTTEFAQRVKSLEIEHHPVQSASAGREVALKVLQPVRAGDAVTVVSGTEAELDIMEDPTFVTDDA